MYLTEKQLRIMEFIQQFRAERGIAPTLEELAKSFKVTKITIYDHMKQLEKKGAIKRDKFRARSIEIIVPVEECMARFSLPLVGNLREGFPIEVAEDQQNLDLCDLVPIGEGSFVLRVGGSLMLEDHITEGDYVIVQEREEVENGETVVAILENGEASFKRFFRDKDRTLLLSSKGSEKVPFPETAKIRGVVIGVLRLFSFEAGNPLMLLGTPLRTSPSSLHKLGQ
jgi:repressor LexA